MSPVGRLAADLWTAPPNTASTAAREDIWQPLCIWHVGQGLLGGVHDHNSGHRDTTGAGLGGAIGEPWESKVFLLVH